MATIHLSVVSPEKTVLEGEYQSFVVPAFDGYMGVMVGHQPTIAALRPGLLEVVDERGRRDHVAIDGGFLEVSGSSAIVLADNAALANEIDVALAERSLDAARRALRGESSEMTTEDATHEIERATNRIRVAKRA